MYNAVMLNRPDAKKYLLSALALLVVASAAYYFIVVNVDDLPQIEIRGYEVMPFEPDGRVVATVLIENIGGEGTIKVYSSAGFALPDTSAREIKRQLGQNNDELVARDLGGVELTLAAQEQQSFTVSGLPPTPEQTRALNVGDLTFYFAGTILVTGGESEQRFCSFVVANKPDDVVPCP